MKLAKVLLVLFVIFTMSSILAASVKGNSFPQLPNAPVTATVNTSVDSYPLSVTLSGVPTGYDVTNGNYTGFCADLLTTIYPNSPYSATLVSSLTIPGNEWPEINYILNNVPPGATGQDIQAAIWLAEGPFTDADILAYAGFTPSALANTMANNAELHGESFTPNSTQPTAVEVLIPGAQTLLIELPTIDVAPLIAAPSDVSVSANGLGGATGLSLGTPTVSSIAYASSRLTVTNDAPALFALGQTTVTWTVTDPSGLYATATQLVSVSDVAPSIAAPSDVSVSAIALGGATVSLGSPVVGSVAYSVSQLTVTNNAPSMFPLGSTTVTWTVTDPSGLHATGTQVVTVNAAALKSITVSLSSTTPTAGPRSLSVLRAMISTAT